MAPSLKFNMLPAYDGQSYLRKFLMNFDATDISKGGDKSTLDKSLIMAVKGTTQ